MQLGDLRHDMIKEGVLGRVIGLTYVIEFQKRGFPHARILLVLHSDDKPRTSVGPDARVCAELPRNRNGLQEEFLQIDTRCMCYCMLRGARGVERLA